jgi:hypothetical protein
MCVWCQSFSLFRFGFVWFCGFSHSGFASRAQGVTVSSSGAEADCIYVFASFSGTEFDNLRNKRKKLMGLRCLTQLLEERREQWPPLDTPVFCLLLEGKNLTSTGFEEQERARLASVVSMMCGRFTQSLTTTVTYLIAQSPQKSSEKYRLAIEQRRIPVLRPQWIWDLWDRQQTIDIADYRVRPFEGLKIAVHGGVPERRREMEHLVKANGGEWCDKAVRTTTHVVVLEKLKRVDRSYARQWGAKLVKPTWFDRCVQLGGLFDENAFLDGAGDHLFVAFLTKDCDAKVEGLVKQCGGVVTHNVAEAEYVVSPFVVAADSPLRNLHNVMIVSPDWLRECHQAGRLVNAAMFEPTAPPSTNHQQQQHQHQQQHQQHNQQRGIVQPSFPLASSVSGAYVPPGRGQLLSGPSSVAAQSMSPAGVFSGNSFQVRGFDAALQAELESLIVQNGGRVVESFPNILVLADGEVATETGRTVSASWLRVAARGQIPDCAHFASLPFPFPCPYGMMRNVHVCLTGFNGAERSLLEDAVQRIGAHYTSQLINGETTHLICYRPEGEKYNRVKKKKWDIATVSVEWLQKCCETGRPVDAALFPVVDAGGMSPAGHLDGAHAGAGGEPKARVLELVTVYFSKSMIIAEQRKYSDIAYALGADVVRVWDASVTHFVHMGKTAPKDLPHESMLDGVIVVSPAWLAACQRAQKRLDEASYPAVLNTRRNLHTTITPSHGGGPSPAVGAPPASGVKRALPDSAITPLPMPTPMTRMVPAPSPAGAVAVSTTASSTGHFGAEDAASVTTPILSKKSRKDEVLEAELDGIVGAITNFAGGADDYYGGAARANSPNQNSHIAPFRNGHSGNSNNSSNNYNNNNNVNGDNKLANKSNNNNNNVNLTGSRDAAVPDRSSSSGTKLVKLGDRSLLGASGTQQFLRRSELKGSGAVVVEHVEGMVSYVDERLLEKQQSVVQATKSGKGTVEEATGSVGSGTKRSRPSSKSLEENSSVELESLSQMQQLEDERSQHPCFTLSKYEENEKLELASIIFNLHGVCDDEFVLGSTDHVIVPVPSRSLKYLLGVAAGVWVLRGEYLRDSAARRRWLPQADYEWSSRALPAGAVQTEEKVALADAPRKMRLRRLSGAKPLMDGVTCIFLGAADHLETYQQLAVVLGAKVLYYGPNMNMSEIRKCTHLFLVANYAMSKRDYDACLQSGVMCFVVEWLVQAIVHAALPPFGEKNWPYVPPQTPVKSRPGSSTSAAPTSAAPTSAKKR